MKSRRVNQTALLLLSLLAIAVLTHAARADDAWLVVDPAAVAAGKSVWLGFVGGSVFPLSETLVAPDDVQAIDDHSRTGRRSLFDAGSSPGAAGCRETLHTPGIHVLAGQLLPQVVEMSGTQFDDYLNEERAADAILERLNDEPDTPVLEEFTRFAKTIIEVGPDVDDDAGFSVAVGHRLEIVPLSNPCNRPIGEVAEFEVLLDGYPWPGVPVSACREGFESRVFVSETVTDERGQAEVAIDSEGLWLVRAHFIRPTTGLQKAEWESFWATLTFHIAPEGTDGPSPGPAGDENVESAAENLDVPSEKVTETVDPPIPFPLDELYGLFSPYLRMADNDAA